MVLPRGWAEEPERRAEGEEGAEVFGGVWGVCGVGGSLFLRGEGFGEGAACG